MLTLFCCLLANPTAEPDTWSTIAPIVATHCADCHQDTGAAPFPLLSHDDLSRRRRFVAEILRRELMPPWLPGDGGLPIHDDRSMPEAERTRLIAWLEAGAPVGNAAEPPTPIAPPEPKGLPSGTVTVPLKEPFSIPAETIENEHRHHQDTWTFVMPLENDEPMHVQGVGWSTAAPAAIHTVTLLADDRCRGRNRDDYDPRVGYERDGDLDQDISGSFGALGVGLSRMMLPDGFHWTIPPASDLVVELKYRPVGRELPLRDAVQLVPADPSGSRSVIPVVTGLNRVRLDAGQADYTEEDRFVLPEDFDVVAVLPRGRNECRSMRLTAELPSGEQRVLMDIPEWDAHYRRPFVFRNVQSLPAGTTLTSRFTLDNSDANPRNPYDPPEDLRIGRRTGVVCFTLLGAGRSETESRTLMDASKWTMDRRGMKNIPVRTPIPPSPTP